MPKVANFRQRIVFAILLICEIFVSSFGGICSCFVYKSNHKYLLLLYHIVLTMKKIVFSFLLVSIFVSKVSSQVGIDFGISETEDKVSNSEIKVIGSLRASYGIFYRYKLNNYFSIRPELNYVRKEFSLEYQNASSVYKEKDFKMDYLSMPVNIEFRKQLGAKKVFFVLSSGPYIGYAMSGKYEFRERLIYKDRANWSKGDIEFGDETGVDMFKRFDYGLKIGAGFDFDNIQLRLNSNFGFYNISSLSDTKCFTRITTLSLGYIFDFN